MRLIERDTAAHEAAHAVVAQIAGLVVHGVDVAPRTAHRGLCHTGYPDPTWPVRTRLGAYAATSMAPVVFAMLRPSLRVGPRQAWRDSSADRADLNPLAVVVGLLQAALILRRRAVRAAVDQLAATLLASSTGRAKGRTVEAICTDLGIFPLRVLGHERPPVLRPTVSVRPRHLRVKVRTR